AIELVLYSSYIFFFQAEDGIRDFHVTGVQTCALPILRPLGGHVAGPRLILVHGNPVLNTVYWTEDRPDRFCLDMAGTLGAKAGRSEERRVGKECRVSRTPEQTKNGMRSRQELEAGIN